MENKTLEALSNELEPLVDRHGLYGVVLALEQVCYAKAEHLRGNWQDESAAKRWERAASQLDKLHAKLVAIQIG